MVKRYISKKVTAKRGRKCSIRTCRNFQQSHKNLSFFRFPKNQPQCEKWIKNADRMDLSGRPNLHDARVCQLHFERHMFKNQFLNRLHKFAIPTLRLSMATMTTELTHENYTSENVSQTEFLSCFALTAINKPEKLPLRKTSVVSVGKVKPRKTPSRKTSVVSMGKAYIHHPFPMSIPITAQQDFRMFQQEASMNIFNASMPTFDSYNNSIQQVDLHHKSMDFNQNSTKPMEIHQKPTKSIDFSHNSLKMIDFCLKPTAFSEFSHQNSATSGEFYEDSPKSSEFSQSTKPDFYQKPMMPNDFHNKLPESDEFYQKSTKPVDSYQKPMRPIECYHNPMETTDSHKPSTKWINQYQLSLLSNNLASTGLNNAPIRQQTDFAYPNRIFTNEQEHQLAGFVRETATYYSGLSSREIRVMAFVYGLCNAVKMPAAWLSNHVATLHWCVAFIKHNNIPGWMVTDFKNKMPYAETYHDNSNIITIELE